MKTPNDLWGAIGEIPEEEALHVITKLFAIYEDKLKFHPDNPEALEFFRHLDNAVTQTLECNLNRR